MTSTSRKPAFLASLLWVLSVCFTVAQANDSSSSYRLYLDADQTNSVSAGQAIELGIRAALSEVNYQLGGHTVELVIKDHHGSTPRSQHHMKQFVSDDMALAVFGGLHSPPLIKSRDFINEHEILTLVPWAAATPITRARTEENWIFRLSLDDSKAGNVIVRDTVVTSKIQRPFLLLEDTGWGKANQKTMTAALARYGRVTAGIHFFQWGIGHHEARTILENAVNQGADGFILVANAPEGATFAKAMLAMDASKHRPIRSHWGITGGTFFNNVGKAAIQTLDLRFIQTRFSLLDHPLSETGQQALVAAAKVDGVTELRGDQVKAPAGFIHAYDLTRLLIAASQETELTGDAQTDRRLIKSSLENLDIKVEGLIKTYHRPFTAYTQNSPDAHEALNEDDFVMAKYDENGNIHLLK